MKNIYYREINIKIKLPNKRFIASFLDLPLIKIEAFAYRNGLINQRESGLMDSLRDLQKQCNDNWSTRSHRRYWLADNIRRYAFGEQANILMKGGPING